MGKMLGALAFSCIWACTVNSRLLVVVPTIKCLHSLQFVFIFSSAIWLLLLFSLCGFSCRLVFVFFFQVYNYNKNIYIYI